MWLCKPQAEQVNNLKDSLINFSNKNIDYFGQETLTQCCSRNR